MNGENLAYFKDGHTEVITEFEISKDGCRVWFKTASGRSFMYAQNWGYADYKFYEIHINVTYEFSVVGRITTYQPKYVVVDEIQKIKIYAVK